ncbi:histidine--tRNA ligase, chloroplastic/mitochondrial isoform X2 [Hevea brasiliensis]|uniref:histidine--tRNA ligase, chloroplastic/mitochondrial isoform X2 n=1 Tax=Hevea brasiliensis TaxID=3981 RepID=UPI0025E0C35E|nr:histidine--tRNA ligase, chloroplastic/mitochondrial isoform X2 [Hevea brasiliensis]
MPPVLSSLHILHPRLSLYVKPLFLRKFPLPRRSLPINPRTLSSVASAQSPTENGDSRGRSGSLSAPPPLLEEAVQKIDVNPPKGTRDFPPEEMRLRNWLFHNFREVSGLYGFEEVDFPVLESEALFIRKAGEEIKDQLYCFEDRGNRRVALRPELTPSLARLVIQKGKSVPLPLKWFAVGQCWRYERMTRGRRREHYQWNMDIIGVPEVTAEAELISSIVTFFKRIGVTASDVGFKVSSRKEVLRCYSISENLFGKVCIIIDKIEKIPMDEIKKDLKSVGMSEEAVEDLLRVLSIKSLTKLEEILGGPGEAVADLKQLFSLAEKFGYSEWIQFDASVVRGLAYYTGIVFEGFDREGKLRAICGGGRYDRLLSTFGGDDIPACGFGFGDAVIVELLKEKGILPELSLQVENIVCALDGDLQGAAATVATILRDKGQSVDLVLENKPLKWVFKRAARINAQRLILVGNTEWQKGMVGVKILSSGEQYEVKLNELE